MTPEKRTSLICFFTGTLVYIPVLSIGSWAGGQWLTINEVYLAPFIPVSMLLILYAVAVVKGNPLHNGLVSTLLMLSIMFAIPNVSYPVGSSYYELLEISFSRLSADVFALGSCGYCFVILRDDMR